jgi:NTE family protein
MGSAGPGHRVGLALSGGGMRAAFFHVGVIARMAEVGLLRKVDVISTVSGGAVVGALYYLKLFVRKPATDHDHLKVAEELVHDFKRAGRHNLRARAFCNPLKNLDMLVRSGYTRSDRIGDLLDKLFFKDTFKERTDAQDLEDRYPFLDRQIELQELDDPKLPTFILNSTCLNTGHNWRFTPQGMGEPLLEEGTERGARLNRIDRNMRFQWLSFADVPSGQRDFPLGLAVAAAAAFPLLFSPLPISNLYAGKRVRLFDGGLHDNQGVEALRDLSCSVFIVSDASGQMEDNDRPSPVLSSLLGRTISVYGDRVREEQLVALDWDKNALLHLREGLPRRIAEVEGEVVEGPPTTVSGVSARAQKPLAQLRTDLDAFSDVEAYSLMLDGYRIAKARLESPPLPPDLLAPSELAPAAPWPFERADAIVANPTPRDESVLAVGSRRFFRPFMRTRMHKALGLLVAAAVVAVLVLLRDPLLEPFGEQAFWKALVFAPLLVLVLPAAGWVTNRALEAVFPEQLARRRPATLSRWAVRLIGAGVAVEVAALAGLWERPERWIGVDWSFWASAGAAAAVIVAPAALGVLAGAFQALDGWSHRRLGKLD